MFLHMPPHFDVPAIVEIASHGAPAFRGGTLSFQRFGTGPTSHTLMPTRPLSGSDGPNAHARPLSGSDGPNAETHPLSGSDGPNAHSQPLSGSDGPNVHARPLSGSDGPNGEGVSPGTGG